MVNGGYHLINSIASLPMEELGKEDSARHLLTHGCYYYRCLVPEKHKSALPHIHRDGAG
jgi:hypothetical protein